MPDELRGDALRIQLRQSAQLPGSTPSNSRQSWRSPATMQDAANDSNGIQWRRGDRYRHQGEQQAKLFQPFAQAGRQRHPAVRRAGLGLTIRGWIARLMGRRRRRQHPRAGQHLLVRHDGTREAGQPNGGDADREPRRGNLAKGRRQRAGGRRQPMNQEVAKADGRGCRPGGERRRWPAGRGEGPAPGGDLILMDMQMPEMNGLRRRGRSAPCPAGSGADPGEMTANAFGEDRRRCCLEASMNDHLSPSRLADLSTLPSPAGCSRRPHPSRLRSGRCGVRPEIITLT